MLGYVVVSQRKGTRTRQLPAHILRALARRPVRTLLVGLILLLVGGAAALLIMRPAPVPASLLDRARLGTWRAPEAVNPPASPVGYQESDFLYLNGQYYLFATGSQDPAWVDVYVGSSPEDLVRHPPAFTHVAPLRYPTVVKDGDTWHLWGVNPPRRWTEHWVSHNADPTGFVYADSPFKPADRAEEPQDKPRPLFGVSPVVDFAVRRNPADGYWYGVGFEIQNNAPLLLTRAASAYGPWEKLNYVPSSLSGGVFGDTGAPPWANAARPDPNLAFTADGRAWIFFTGQPVTQQPPSILHRAGMVEVDVQTGKAIGNPVVLFDPEAHPDLSIGLASDLGLVSVPGQPDRVLGYTHDPRYPLAVLDVPDLAPADDGRTAADLVRLDMARGFGVAPGITPVTLHSPYRWSAAGLEVPDNDGLVGSYLAGAYLGDLTFQVEFTAERINAGALNTVAYIGGPDYNQGAAVSVQIDATDELPLITATLRGDDGATVTLASGIAADTNTNYAVLLRRSGDQVSLVVNGSVQATATYGAPLTGLESWSLTGAASLIQAARYPFQGAIHSFVVTGSGS
jgi:hypothetical protein